MFDHEPRGATPIPPDESADLIPTHVRTRTDLNEWEQANILIAANWAERTRMVALDEPFVRELHRRMFDRTWTWAGRYRKSDTNLGADWQRIPTEVREVIDTGLFWFENGTFPVDEAALRLHHRMVLVHPFPNGNGRHARLWCDTILRRHGRPPIDWKPEQLGHAGDVRRRYIDGLRAADGGDYAPLIGLLLGNRG
jgi:Fic-DOC domain mobile mystery protein B